MDLQQKRGIVSTAAEGVLYEYKIKWQKVILTYAIAETVALPKGLMCLFSSQLINVEWGQRICQVNKRLQQTQWAAEALHSSLKSLWQFTKRKKEYYHFGGCFLYIFFLFKCCYSYNMSKSARIGRKHIVGSPIVSKPLHKTEIKAKSSFQIFDFNTNPSLNWHLVQGVTLPSPWDSCNRL